MLNLTPFIACGIFFLTTYEFIKKEGKWKFTIFGKELNFDQSVLKQRLLLCDFNIR